MCEERPYLKPEPEPRGLPEREDDPDSPNYDESTGDYHMPDPDDLEEEYPHGLS